MSPGEWAQKFTDIFEVFTQSDNYKKKLRERHEKYGAFRSAEGTREEII